MTVFINNHTKKNNGNGFYILDLIKNLKLNSTKIISLSCQNQNNKIFTFRNKKKENTLIGKVFEIFLLYYLILKNLNQLKNEKVIFTSDPPMTGLLLIIIKKFVNCKIIFWCQDIFPDTLVVSNVLKKNNILFFILKKINQLIYKNSDIIVTVSTSMKETLNQNYKINKKKIMIIQNWNSLKKKKVRVIKKSKINIFYNGNISMVHDYKFAFSVISKIINKDLRIKIYTNSNKIKNKINKNYIVKGFLNEKSHFKHILESDFQMLFSKPSALKTIYPSKIYNFLFYEKPILYFNRKDNDEISKMLKKYNIGININKKNKGKIISLFSNTNKIKKILRVYKKNYKKIHFNKTIYKKSFDSWKKLI